ncbi:AraC family transcriptional regulator [Chamaesiphon sp. VAR_48_metabat_403]|uniref:AraC family transcriptional regulator n=1 Tax=Chamaesiphon sp. VAR_48_metabat_403 TaxID=2964700 RepID=UPI00286E7428|nr:AraC family transcriptional regulator [Chamaesiphon sp. VAR_48_metabat_403]
MRSTLKFSNNYSQLILTSIAMTIDLALSEFEELWAQTNSPLNEESVGLEALFHTPPSLGSGCHWEIQLDAEFTLSIWDIQGRDDVRVQQIESKEHPIEFGVLLSGCISSNVGNWNQARTLISGGGIQRKMVVDYHQAQPMIGVCIELSPARLAMLFPGEDGQLESELEFLAKGDDWQSILYPPNTAEIARVVQQIRFCPYRGTTKRMYLQAKALEIMSLQLAPVLAGGDTLRENRSAEPEILPKLKSQTIAKLHYAQEIIQSRLDNPPTSTELSQQLDLSDRTLRRGFRSLFGTTIVGYLTEQRLQQAELLLRNTDRTVADIANYVGYAHLGYFARAFKRKYGINPSDCRQRKAQA